MKVMLEYYMHLQLENKALKARIKELESSTARIRLVEECERKCRKKTGRKPEGQPSHKGLCRKKEEVKGTVTEDYQGILVHDQDLTFYNYEMDYSHLRNQISIRFLNLKTENKGFPVVGNN